MTDAPQPFKAANMRLIVIFSRFVVPYSTASDRKSVVLGSTCACKRNRQTLDRPERSDRPNPIRHR